MKRTVFSFLTVALLTAVSLRADVQYLSGSSKVQMKDAPPAVQNAIKAQAGSAKIEDLERGTLSGRTLYEAAFKKNGKHTELRVAEDGTIVDTIVAGVSQGTGASTTASTTTTTATTTGGKNLAYEAGFSDRMSGEQKVPFNQVPANIQKIIKEHAGSAKIEDVDKGKIRGTTFYQAAYKKNGQHVELRVSEDTQFVREVAGTTTLFSTYGWQTGFNNELRNSKVVKLEELPANIQQTIKSKLGSAQIETVRQGTVNGTTTFQVGYSQNNQHGELRVAQDGQFFKQVLGGKVIGESAGAQTGKLK